MMTKLEESLIGAILFLLYEPKLHEGADKHGDYGGFNVERRYCMKQPDSDDPIYNGYELFVTTINDQKYIGLYRTWGYDEDGDDGGSVEALIKVICFDAKYDDIRYTEARRLIKKFDVLLSLLEES